jgi:hypothetical protein
MCHRNRPSNATTVAHGLHAAGEPNERILTLAAWRESSYCTDAEHQADHRRVGHAMDAPSQPVCLKTARAPR